MENANFAILDQIKSITMESDFTNAQSAFFDMHMGTFEDTEENKLAYTQVFEQYVLMCDEMITAKLKDQHNSEAVDQFYDTFKDNINAYKEQDELAVETLYGFIDFEKFKETILRFKKDKVQFDRKPEDRPELRQDLTTDDGYAHYQKLAQEDVNDPQYKWVKKVNQLSKPGFTLDFWQKSSSSPNITKTNVVMKDITLEQADAYMKDIENQAKANPAVKEVTVLETDAHGFPAVLYSKNKMPMMTDRESLTKIVRKQIDNDTVIWVINSIDHPSRPRTDLAIRINVFKGSQFRRVEGGIMYEEFATFDLGGYFPMSMLNMVMKSMVSKGVEEFYKNVKKMEV